MLKIRGIFFISNAEIEFILRHTSHKLFDIAINGAAENILEKEKL